MGRSATHLAEEMNLLVNKDEVPRACSEVHGRKGLKLAKSRKTGVRTGCAWSDWGAFWTRWNEWNRLGCRRSKRTRAAET